MIVQPRMLMRDKLSAIMSAPRPLGLPQGPVLLRRVRHCRKCAWTCVRQLGCNSRRLAYTSTMGVAKVWWHWPRCQAGLRAALEAHGRPRSRAHTRSGSRLEWTPSRRSLLVASCGRPNGTTRESASFCSRSLPAGKAHHGSEGMGVCFFFASACSLNIMYCAPGSRDVETPTHQRFLGYVATRLLCLSALW